MATIPSTRHDLTDLESYFVHIYNGVDAISL